MDSYIILDKQKTHQGFLCYFPENILNYFRIRCLESITGWPPRVPGSMRRSRRLSFPPVARWPDDAKAAAQLVAVANRLQDPDVSEQSRRRSLIFVDV